MQDRLNTAKIAYLNLIKFNANTKYKNKVDLMSAEIEKKLQIFNK
jgi:outer membrane protein assembly factor BamD